MRKIVGILAIIAAASIILLTRQQSHQISHSVKVQVENGHGSATHIGNGIFLTAAHVVKDQETVKIKSENGNIRSGSVLWASDKYDVALILSEGSGIGVAEIDCRMPIIAENVTLTGNPLNLDDIITWGKVAGSARPVGPWANVVPMNAAIAPGMSGGGAFDDDGDLIGVNVGVMIMPMGLGGGPVQISYMVPADTVCMLLGRFD